VPLDCAPMRSLRFLFACALFAPAAGLVFAACGGSVDSGGVTDVDTGTGGSDVSIVEGGSDAGTDTSLPPTETGGGTVKCGSETCNAATQECCAGTSGLKCLDKGKCGGGTVVPCSDPSSCPGGEVCCAQRDGFSLKVACQATCTGGGFTLCSSDTDCKSPDKCQTGLAGFKFCGGRPDGGGFDVGGFDVGGFLDGGLKPDIGSGG